MMKAKLLICLLICLFALPLSAAERTIELTWTKETIELDLQMFVVEYSLDNTNWQLLKEFLYTHPDPPVTGPVSFGEVTEPITIPDSAVTNLYFRIRAEDTSGNYSAWVYSNSVEVDLAAPATVIDFKATVKVVTP